MPLSIGQTAGKKRFVYATASISCLVHSTNHGNGHVKMGLKQFWTKNRLKLQSVSCMFVNQYSYLIGGITNSQTKVETYYRRNIRYMPETSWNSIVENVPLLVQHEKNKGGHRKIAQTAPTANSKTAQHHLPLGDLSVCF